MSIGRVYATSIAMQEMLLFSKIIFSNLGRLGGESKVTNLFFVTMCVLVWLSFPRFLEGIVLVLLVLTLYSGDLELPGMDMIGSLVVTDVGCNTFGLLLDIFFLGILPFAKHPPWAVVIQFAC